jgi:hypothetical protein
MPFAGAVKEDIAGGEAAGVGTGLVFAAAGEHEGEAELGEGAAFPPVEEEKGRVALRVGFAGGDAFPAGVSEVKGLVKEPVADGQGVPEGLEESAGLAHLLVLMPIVNRFIGLFKAV